MSIVTQLVYKVEIDLTLSDGTISPYQDISDFELVSMNDQEVSHTTEGSFEGLFDFYFTEFSLDLKGDWFNGVDFRGMLSRISPYARVKISRSYQNNKTREFYGYVSLEGMKVESIAPGFYKSTGMVLSYATFFKESPIGKISTYESRTAPQETFSLYRKTVQAVPFEINVPQGADPEDYVEDVDFYIEPSTYLQEGSIIPGDRIEFERVAIFDTKTLSRPINTDTDLPFYRELPDGYEGASGVFDGWYSHGLKSMPVKTISSILESALECVNKYGELVGRGFPQFRLLNVTVPPLVYVQGVSILTGAWHVQVISHSSRVFAFVWTDQFSVSIYEITNGVQVSSIGSYSWTPPSLEWLKDNSRTGHIGEQWSGIAYATYPGHDWEYYRDARVTNPQAYTQNHPDGTMFARVFGATGNKIYFGWSSTISTRAAYNQTNQYRAEANTWSHAASLDITNSRIEHNPPSFVGAVGQTHYYSDYQVARWTVVGIDYSSHDDYYYGTLLLNQIRRYVPVLQGDNSFENVSVESGFYSFHEWIGHALGYNPLEVSGYSRSAYSLFYIGPLLGDKFSLFLQDKKASDLVMLVCKLTNSAPVISFDGGNVSLGFRQRPMYNESYEQKGSYVADYVLNDSSVFAYNIQTQNFLKDDDVDIQIDLENVPDSLQKAFRDFYRYKFMPRGLTFHLVNVPLVGPLVPSWLTTIQTGNKVKVLNKVLEYVGPKERELDATLIFMER